MKYVKIPFNYSLIMLLISGCIIKCYLNLSQKT